MRNRFEQQLSIGILPIEETEVSAKIKDPLTELLAALSKYVKKYDYIKGWRKLSNWRQELKGLMREGRRRGKKSQF